MTFEHFKEALEKAIKGKQNQTKKETPDKKDGILSALSSKSKGK